MEDNPPGQNLGAPDGATTAHENVLKNIDLVDIILDHLDSDEDPQEARLTFAHAARVCHSFAHVALPRVWRRLHDLAPLWNILLPDDARRKTPAYLANEATDREREKVIDMVKRAELYRETSRWRRFLTYASYVQRLDIPFRSDGEKDLLRLIIAHNEGRTFLPALRCLTWLQRKESKTTLASFAPASLADLRFYGRRRDFPRSLDDTKTIVARLPSWFPTLQKLVLNEEMGGPPYQEFTLYTPLKSMKHLRSLRIVSDSRKLDYDMLRQLFAALPLEELFFWIADLDDLTCPAPIEAPHLRTLESKGPVVDIVALLLHLHAPSLTAFKFENFFFDASPEHVWYLFDTISQPTYSRTMKSLSVSMQAAFKTDAEVVDLFMDVLFPVLSMKQLEHLSFVYPKELDEALIALVDEDIGLLAQGLPNLRFLELFYDPVDLKAFPPLSVMSLVYLAQHCPRLEELHLQTIDIDLHNVTIPASAPTAASNHPLRVLAIRDQSFMDNDAYCDEFFELLDRLFPNLRTTVRPDVLPESLQPPKLTLVWPWEGWRRCAPASPRRVFVCH